MPPNPSTLWLAEEPPRPLAGSLWLAADGRLADARPDGDAVLIEPTRAPPGDATRAVALVPDEHAAPVLHNGLAIGAGLHLLRHGDRLQLGSAVAWFSAEARPEQTTYDPTEHGEDAFCARTKSRLTPGDDIVVCPGTPTASCELVFKASAWDETTTCHGCGYDPKTPPWTPPRHAPGKDHPVHDLHDLLQLASED